MTTGCIRRRTGWARLIIAFGMVAALTSMGAPRAHAAPPSHDDVSEAVVVAEFPYTHTVDTSEATSAEGDRCGSATVWYVFHSGH
jgi:hypothetical protein